MNPESTTPRDGSKRSICLSSLWDSLKSIQGSPACSGEESQQLLGELPTWDKGIRKENTRMGTARSRNEGRLVKPDQISPGFPKPSPAAAPKLQSQGEPGLAKLEKAGAEGT